jgi:hypothetical protein
MAQGKQTGQRDSTGRLMTEWRGPCGEVAKEMHPNYPGRCATCNDPYPITTRDIALVVKADRWRLYHLDKKCRPSWVE